MAPRHSRPAALLGKDQIPDEATQLENPPYDNAWGESEIKSTLKRKESSRLASILGYSEVQKKRYFCVFLRILLAIGKAGIDTDQ
jgi:hypothetical protein